MPRRGSGRRAIRPTRETDEYGELLKIETISSVTKSSQNSSNYTLASGKDQLVFGWAGRPSWQLLGFLACGSTSTLGYWRLSELGRVQEKIPEFVMTYLGLFLLYLASLWLSRLSPSGLRVKLFLILLFALTFRLPLVLIPPGLSDDVYRYVWEGYLQTEGINPYGYSPQSPVLVDYRNQIWPSINNKEVSAVYPPFAQMVHALIFLGFRSVTGFKLAFLLVEIGLVAAILALLRLRGEQLSQVLVYAWNPLVVVEVAWSGHHDVLVVGLLFWAVFLLQIRRVLPALSFLGAAALSKLYPLIMLPTFLRGLSTRYWGWLIAVLMVMIVPYLGAGKQILDGLNLYRDHWRFNGFLFSWLTGHGLSQTWVEGLLGTSLLVLLGFCLLGGYCRLRQLFWLTGAVLLFSPSLYPWYLVWIIPYLCFYPNSAWLLLSGISVVSYAVLIDWSALDVWRSDPLFLKLQYYPFFGMLMLIGIRSLWQRRRGPTP